MKNRMITLIMIAILLVAMFALTACGTNEELTENTAVANQAPADGQGEPTPPAKPAGGEHAPEDEGQAPKENLPPPEGEKITLPQTDAE